MLHHFTDVLRMLPGRDQQSIFGLDNNQIGHADCRDELSRRMHIVALRIQNKSPRAVNDIAFGWIALRRVMLVQRRPRTQVIPAEISRQTIDFSRLFALGRTWLKYGVVDADVLTL